MAEQSQINKVNIFFYICLVVFYVVFSFLEKKKLIKKKDIGVYDRGVMSCFGFFFFFFHVLV